MYLLVNSHKLNEGALSPLLSCHTHKHCDSIRYDVTRLKILNIFKTLRYDTTALYLHDILSETTSHGTKIKDIVAYPSFLYDIAAESQEITPCEAGLTGHNTRINMSFLSFRETFPNQAVNFLKAVLLEETI